MTYFIYTSHRLLISLGVEPLYNTQNPFEWMEMISLTGKTNFFERRVSEYSKASVQTKLNQKGSSTTTTTNISTNTFVLDEDF